MRDGFSFARHPLSLLANGPGGSVQTTNFVVSGLMVIAAALGMWRVLRPAGRAATIVLAGYGVAMLAAAVFKADPMDGFPVGTPPGPPTSISASGLGHFAAGGLGFIALAVSALLAARVMRRRSQRTMAHVSLSSGLLILIGFFGGSRCRRWPRVRSASGSRLSSDGRGLRLSPVISTVDRPILPAPSRGLRRAQPCRLSASLEP